MKKNEENKLDYGTLFKTTTTKPQTCASLEPQKEKNGERQKGIQYNVQGI